MQIRDLFWKRYHGLISHEELQRNLEEITSSPVMRMRALFWEKFTGFINEDEFNMHMQNLKNEIETC